MGPVQLLLWIALAFALALAVHRWLRRARRIAVGRRGLYDPRLGWGWIPWDEVLGVYPPQASDESLRVKLRVTDRLAGVLAGESVEPVGGAIEIRLDLRGSEIDPVELMQRILAGTRADAQPTSSP